MIHRTTYSKAQCYPTEVPALALFFDFICILNCLVWIVSIILSPSYEVLIILCFKWRQFLPFTMPFWRFSMSFKTRKMTIHHATSQFIKMVSDLNQVHYWSSPSVHLLFIKFRYREINGYQIFHIFVKMFAYGWPLNHWGGLRRQ